MRWIFLFVTVAAFAENSWDEAREFYKKHGYLWIKGFFSKPQVEMLQMWADDVGVASESLLDFAESSGLPLSYLIHHLPGSPIVVPEVSNPKMACRAEDFVMSCPDLYDFVTGSVAPYVGRLFGEGYVLFKDKINFKWPGGGAFLPHQDFPAYEFLGPREHVTAMITIDTATRENGCLKVAKNYEGSGVLPFIVGGKAHGSIEPEALVGLEWEELLTDPSDLVIFSSYVPHASEKNMSTGPRRAMFFTFNKLREGEHRQAYYHAKRCDPENPIFHIGTPTVHK